jgi:indole-3-glycerol phosphate synthase
VQLHNPLSANSKKDVHVISIAMSGIYETVKILRRIALNGCAVGSSFMDSLGDSFLKDGFSLS